MSGHCKTQIFSLIGRRVQLNQPYRTVAIGREPMQRHLSGVIVEQLGPARFGLHLDDYAPTVDFHRGEFTLPPLPKSERQPTWLPDNFDGFVYADEPNF